MARSSLRQHVFNASALLLGVLVLSACNGNSTLSAAPTQQPTAQQPTTQQPAPVTTTPASKQALGLYQLSLTGGQSGLSQATVSRVGFSTQGLEAGGLSFKSNNYGTYIDQVTGTLHMWATFDVTNNSTQSLAAPTFMPVDTEGQTATIGATAFSNLKYFDGSDASSKATSLNFDTSSDPKTTVNTPLITNLDSGDIQVNLPAGTTLGGISRSGWKMAALPAGATGQITLATSIAQASNPSQNPFSFNLVFTVADNVPTTTISSMGAVQGSTPAGDIAGPSGAQTVAGVVTAVTPGLSGFFVQDQGINADKDGNTSDGIFVYCANSCPVLNVGDLVKVSGTAAEYKGATQLTAPTITKQGSGFGLPEAVSLQLPLDSTQLERYEGMRVTFPDTLTVTNNYTYGRYGQLGLSNAGRMFVPTNGNAGTVSQSTITLDDAQGGQNPLDLPYLSSQNTRRTGDTVTGLSGVWHTVANLPMLEPTGTVNFTDANPRPDQPKDVGGSLRVGGANVLNYFTDLNSNYGGTYRGANTAAELSRQRTKMANTLVGLNADVLTLMEVENNNDTALNDIVAALNEKAGSGTYAAITTGKVGTDAIKVAIVYKPAKVTPIGAPMIDTNSVYSRPPVAQTFQDKATNGVFSVVANHLKSKGSCPTSGDTDQGQGCWNQLRVQQAQQLLNFVSSIQQTSGDQDVLLLGDFNAYGAEDPIKALQSGGFESLNLRIPAEDRYSYQYSGLFGYLDHALASANLSNQVTGITEWHVNSDEPTIADYNTEYKSIPECVVGAGGTANTCQGKDLYNASNPFRASDHDPVLVGLNLKADAVTTPTASTALSANPAALTIAAGGASVSSTLSTSTQNYTGADLKITTNNAAGLSVTPSVTTVGRNATFSLSVTAPAGMAAGTYPVTVTTTGDAGLTANTTINVTVTAGGSVPTTMNHLVLSQVYGGGGNSGATYKNDFIEIFNPTSSDISLSGYNVEYFSSAGNSGGKTALSGTVKAGSYYLVQESAGTGGTQSLPAPDATGTLTMSSTSGSVALSNGTIIDLVGFGTAATKFEGAATGNLSNTNAALRNGGGCVDTDNNKNDFTLTTAAPRNSSTAPVTCN